MPCRGMKFPRVLDRFEQMHPFVSSRAFSTLDLDLEIWLEGINEFCEKSYEKSELKKESMNFLILVCLMNSN